MKKREIRFPTILGLLVAVGGLVSGLWLVQNQIRNSTQAAEEIIPKEVVVTNISDSGFTVSWVTDKAISGYLLYGEGQTDLSTTASDDRDQNLGEISAYLTHYVTVRGLKPETTYGFKIGSGKQTFGLSELPYMVHTGPVLVEQPVADVAYGQVLTPAGEPAEGALLYVQLAGAVRLSTVVKNNGSYAVPLSTARTADLKSYLEYDKQTTPIVIEVNGGGIWGITSLKTTTGQDSPVDEITMGAGEKDEESEGSKLSESSDGLNGLVLLSPFSGEKVNSATPIIIGAAPAGTEIEVVVNSESLITGRTTADETGSFSYTVPQNLEPGQHTITISAVVNGVVKRVSRSFTVYAVGESFDPAFSASPSSAPLPTSKPVATTTPVPTTPVVVIATSAPTPKPTATPLPTRSPDPVITISPTPTQDLVTSGAEEYSLIMLLVGTFMLVYGAMWYKRSW